MERRRNGHYSRRRTETWAGRGDRVSHTCSGVGTVSNRRGDRYGIEFLAENAAESDQVNRVQLMLQTLGSPAGE